MKLVTPSKLQAANTFYPWFFHCQHTLCLYLAEWKISISRKSIDPTFPIQCDVAQLGGECHGETDT